MTYDNNQGGNQQAFDKLLALTAKKMGMTPQMLKNKLESGQMNAMINKAAASDPALAKALNDPAAAQRLLSDPAAAKIISSFLKKN